MKNHGRNLATILVVLGLVFACRHPTSHPGNPTPVAGDYNINGDGIVNYDGIPKEVSISAKPDKSGGTVTVYYNGVATAPKAVGSYTVTFNVAASDGWNAVSGLYAGILTIFNPDAYVITGSGTMFEVCKNNVPKGTGTIQDVINAVNTDAGGTPCFIQFGDNMNVLDIGTEHIEFIGSSWGKITLSGKITSSNTSGTIFLQNAVMVDSEADIENTVNYAIYSISSGDLNIIEGTHSGIINGSGTMNINGGSIGIVFASNSSDLHITNGTIDRIFTSSPSRIVNVNISGGKIGMITHYSRGKITISGDAIVTSSSADPTIGLLNSGYDSVLTDKLEIKGGLVKNTGEGPAVMNYTSGYTKIIISGGSVQSNGNFAVIFHSSTANTAQLQITGGVIEGVSGYAIRCPSGDSEISLSGSPIIVGMIQPRNAGALKVTGSFNPGAEMYMLAFSSYNNGMTAVAGGASYLSNFELYNQQDWTLAASGANLVVVPVP